MNHLTPSSPPRSPAERRREAATARRARTITPPDRSHPAAVVTAPPGDRGRERR